MLVLLGKGESNIATRQATQLTFKYVSVTVL